MIIPFRLRVDYRFKQGTPDDLMALTCEERRDTNRVTCKCCGRLMPREKQSLGNLYACSPTCRKQIEHILLNEYVVDEPIAVAY